MVSNGVRFVIETLYWEEGKRFRVLSGRVGG
jgi:hypothetical protein